jgi:hypothetical protein
MLFAYYGFINFQKVWITAFAGMTTMQESHGQLNQDLTCQRCTAYRKTMSILLVNWLGGSQWLMSC